MTRARIPCPPIVVYKAINTAPEGYEYTAWHFLPVRIRGSDGAPDRPGHTRLGVWYRGSTEDEAAKKAHDCWERSQDELDAKAAALKPVRKKA